MEMTHKLTWNEGNANGTSFVGYLGAEYELTRTAAKFTALGAQDFGPSGDNKTTIEFQGTFDGQTFTLYDYKGDGTFHIGGRQGLDVEALKAYLRALLET